MRDIVWYLKHVAVELVILMVAGLALKYLPLLTGSRGTLYATGSVVIVVGAVGSAWWAALSLFNKDL